MSRSHCLAVDVQIVLIDDTYFFIFLSVKVTCTHILVLFNVKTTYPFLDVRRSKALTVLLFLNVMVTYTTRTHIVVFLNVKVT